MKHTCDVCGRKYVSESRMIRHKARMHPNHGKGMLTGMLNAIEHCGSIPEMLTTAAKWIDTEGGTLTPQIVEQLKREDAKALMYMRVVVALHLTSTMRLAQKREMLQDSLLNDLTPEAVKEMSLDTRMSLMKLIEDHMTFDREAITEFHKLTTIDMSDTIDSLMRAIAPMVNTVAALPLSPQFSNTVPYMLPENPQIREQMRKLFQQVDITQYVDLEADDGKADDDESA